MTNYPGTWGTPYCLTLAAGEQAEAAPAEPAWVLPLPGVSAPYGPRFAAPGSERLAWADAPAFAGLSTPTAP